MDNWQNKKKKKNPSQITQYRDSEKSDFASIQKCSQMSDSYVLEIVCSLVRDHLVERETFTRDNQPPNYNKHKSMYFSLLYTMTHFKISSHWLES